MSVILGIVFFACRPFGDFESLDIPNSTRNKFESIKSTLRDDETLQIYKCIEDEVYLVEHTRNFEGNGDLGPSYDTDTWYYNRHGCLLGVSTMYSDVGSWVDPPPVEIDRWTCYGIEYIHGE